MPPQRTRRLRGDGLPCGLPGACRFIALDSYACAGRTRGRRRLRPAGGAPPPGQIPNRWTIITYHHPLFPAPRRGTISASSGRSGRPSSPVRGGTWSCRATITFYLAGALKKKGGGGECGRGGPGPSRGMPGTCLRGVCARDRRLYLRLRRRRRPDHDDRTGGGYPALFSSSTWPAINLLRFRVQDGWTGEALRLAFDLVKGEVGAEPAGGQVSRGLHVRSGACGRTGDPRLRDDRCWEGDGS